MPSDLPVPIRVPGQVRWLTPGLSVGPGVAARVWRAPSLGPAHLGKRPRRGARLPCALPAINTGYVVSSYSIQSYVKRVLKM